MTGRKGHELMAALTQGQVETVIAAAFRLLGEAGIERLQSAVDDESAKVLKDLFAVRHAKTPVESTESKLALEWREAWDRWHNATADLGDEDGPYSYKEHHWQAPSFDGSAFADSLDKAADAVLPLIDRACALRIEDDDFFREEIQEIDQGIDTFPDWMESEDCGLGPVATSCFLRWEWCVSVESGSGPKGFLESIGGVEQALQHVSLDSMTFVEFFPSLPALDQKAALQALHKLKDDPSWKKRFVSTYSDWQKMERALLARHDRKAYLQDSLERLKDEWSLGIPVVEHAVTRKEFKRADDVLAATMAGLFGSRDTEKSWSPETELITDRLGYRARFDDENVGKLLSLAMTVSTGLGNGPRASVFELQKTVYTSSDDWDAVGGAFRKYLDSPIARHARILLEKWKTLMANRSLGRTVGKNTEPDTWVHDLIEAGVHDAKGPEWFRTQLTKRLKNFADNPKTSTGERRAQIVVLIGDLSAVTSLKKTHPRLVRVVGKDTDRSGSDECRKARRVWLGRMGVESLLPALFAFLKRNGTGLVPDPGAAYGSRYEEQAAWLDAIREIDKDAFRKLLSQWKSTYGRRRNLWTALHGVGIE